MRTHIQIGTPVFSGVPSRGLKNVQPKKFYSAHPEYLSRSMLYVSLHDNLLLSRKAHEARKIQIHEKIIPAKEVMVQNSLAIQKS